MAVVALGCFAFTFGWFTERFNFFKRKPEHERKREHERKTEHTEIHARDSHLPPLETAEKYRHDASTHAENRGRYLDESHAAYANNNKKAAKELADRGKTEGLLMEECNKVAADTYFNYNNPKQGMNGEGYIDLHCLQVKEALSYADISIQNEMNKTDYTSNNRRIVFIVGMGNHSEGGIRKIKPALEKMIIEKYGFQIIDEKPHKGCLSVEFVYEATFKSKNNNNNNGNSSNGIEKNSGVKKEKSSGCVIA